ncbi:hypothetical protein MBLNU459_g5033t2 [Dothideomycetes sp. NU459]
MDVDMPVAAAEESMELDVIETATKRSHETQQAGTQANVMNVALPETQMTPSPCKEDEQPATNKSGKLRRAAVMSGLFTTLFISALNTTIVATAIPTISAELKSAAGYAWIERSLYLGFLQVVWAISGGTGPVLGGLFTEYLSWRWIFWINLPISGTSFLLLFFFLRIHNPRTPFILGLKAIDWYGSASMLGVMIMLLLGFDFGGTAFPWKSPTVICLIISSGLMFLFFIIIERTAAKYPLMPLGIFKDRSNVASLAVCFFHHFCYTCLEYYLPLFFQSVLGRSPLLSGALSAPLSAVTGLAGIFSGILIHRTGRYLELIYIGAACLLIGTSLLTLLSATSTVPTIVGFEIVTGIGTGLLFEPALVALLALLPKNALATTTSTAGLVRNLASCFGIVIGGVIFENGISDQAAGLHSAGLSPSLVERLTGSTAAANVGLIATIEDPEQGLAVRKAFAESLRIVWITCVGMAAGLAICGVFVKKRHLSDVYEETRTGITDDKRSAGERSERR